MACCVKVDVWSSASLCLIGKQNKQVTHKTPHTKCDDYVSVIQIVRQIDRTLLHVCIYFHFLQIL